MSKVFCALALLIATGSVIAYAFERGRQLGFDDGVKVVIEKCPATNGHDKLLSSSIFPDRVVCTYAKTYAGSTRTIVIDQRSKQPAA